MADTYEQNLGQKSSLTVNDFIRVVGTDNVSYKQLVSDVAKKIIENYTGSSLAGSSQSVKSALDALNSKTIYTSDNGMQLSKVGKVAQIDIMPSMTTTASSAVVDTITNTAYRPTVDVDIATRVYNGSSYVDCWFQITTSGTVSIKSATGGAIAGFQARYCKLKGLTYLCQG